MFLNWSDFVIESIRLLKQVGWMHRCQVPCNIFHAPDMKCLRLFSGTLFHLSVIIQFSFSISVTDVQIQLKYGIHHTLLNIICVFYARTHTFLTENWGGGGVDAVRVYNIQLKV